MKVASAERTATIWFERDLPVELVWRGQRWEVLDAPTRIGLSEDDIFSALVTHPPQQWTDWRFVARSQPHAETYVFDIRETGDRAWEVLHVFD